MSEEMVAILTSVGLTVIVTKRDAEYVVIAKAWPSRGEQVVVRTLDRAIAIREACEHFQAKAVEPLTADVEKQ